MYKKPRAYFVSMVTDLSQSPSSPFAGFDTPHQNWFKMPNDWTDITADLSSIAELKVVEYVLKHTWGYQEYGVRKRITNDEFMQGRKRKDGTRMDKGTGLTKKSVIAGIKSALARGLLIEEVDDSDKARVKNTITAYRQASQAQAAEQAAHAQAGRQRLHAQYGTTAEELAFWEKAQVELKFASVAYPDLKIWLADAAILNRTATTAQIGIPQPAYFRQLGHPGTQKVIQRALTHAAGQRLAPEFVLLAG